MPGANNKIHFLVWEPAGFSQFGYIQVISLVCLRSAAGLLSCGSSVDHARLIYRSGTS